MRTTRVPLCRRTAAVPQVNGWRNGLRLPNRGAGRYRSAMSTLVGSGAILLWSCLALLTAASGAIPPFELAAVTFAIGGALGFTATALRGRLSALRQPWPVWALGVGGLFGYHALYFAALRTAPPAQAGLIAYLWPLLIVLLSTSLPGEPLTLRHLVGAGLGLAGVVVLIVGAGQAQFTVDTRYALGDGLALACAFVWSGYSILSRRLSQVPTDAVAGFCLATALLAGVAHLVFETTVLPETGGQWLAIAGLGLGPVGAAFYLWDIGVKHGDIRLLGVASYAAPLLSTAILVCFGFARPTVALAVACLLIVAGAGLAAIPRAAPRAVPGRT